MDLLGGCNSDSDSDDNNAPATTTATIARSLGATRGNQDRKQPPPTSTAATAVTESKSSNADKKKRVVGKKLLKLSAVLPEHILNQLQLSGGGGAKDKYNAEIDDADTSDDSSNDEDDNVDDSNKKASSRRKATTTTASTAAAASPRDYSRDEGIMGLLSALSKSNSTSSSRKQAVGTKILGSEELFSSSTEQVVHNNNDSSTMPLIEKPKSKPTRSEPLGAAFLTATVETVTRKRKEPSIVRSIHDRNEDTPSSATTSSSTTQVPRSSATSVHSTSSYQASSAVPRPSASAIAPPRVLRVKATSSSRSAAPRVGIPSTTAHSLHNQSSTYTPVMSLQHSNSSHEQQVYRQKHQDAHSAERGHSKKKKPLSRKRQMEQMLRAGKLDQVQGDHELQGVAHVYQQEGDLASAMTSSSSSNNNNNNNTGGAGVRVVPTGTYDASLGATAMSTDVSSRQKNSNQLNSLLANAASLESHRAQNPQFNGMMGVKGKSGSHRANAKTKYGW
jgi:hypothetical protein